MHIRRELSGFSGMFELRVGSVTSRGRVTIPKGIRDSLDIAKGDQLVFLKEGDMVIIRKVKDEKLTTLLEAHKPMAESGVSFQRRLRRENNPRHQLFLEHE